MARCLQLAEKGLGRVAPNPMVGSVIVNEGKIIGEGFHDTYGRAHAEVNAIASLGEQKVPNSAIIYVSLEPCSHHGKTPPCANLIIEKGFKKVVVAQTDPNPKVAGRGINRLREAGVEVIQGVLEKEAKELNRRFRTFHEKSRPFIILKWAESADGFMDYDRGNHEKGIFWISAPSTKKLVHRWRAEEGAILVGATTVINDNLRLDVRKVKGRNPLRVVLSGTHSFQNRHILEDGNPTLILGQKAGKYPESVRFVDSKDEDPIRLMLAELFDRGYNSLIVEGGRATLLKFIEEELWDEARIIKSHKLIGSGLKAPSVNLPAANSFYFGDDRIDIYRRV